MFKAQLKEILLNDGFMSPLIVDSVIAKILELAEGSLNSKPQQEKAETPTPPSKGGSTTNIEEPKYDKDGSYKVLGENGIMQIRHRPVADKTKSIVANPMGKEVVPGEARSQKIGTPSVKIAPHYANPKE